MTIDSSDTVDQASPPAAPAIAIEQLVLLDPNDIVVNVANPRERARRIEDLKASISQIGLLDPLTVFLDEDGRHVLRDGFRRRTAAIELGLDLVPCRVVEAGGTAEQVVAMLASALHRDELTVTEEAAGYRQLELEGWDAEAIATVVARPAARVSSALALTRLPTTAQAAADQGMLELDHVVALQEFANDPEALAKVVEKGASGPWGFQHAIRDAKNRRDRKAAVEKAKAELVLAGVKIVAEPKDFPWASKMAKVADLVDADGNALNAKKVRSQPGFAAIVKPDGNSGVMVTYVCLDPEGHGLTRLRHSSYISPEELAEQHRREQERLAQAEALRAASEVRREFVKTTYRSAKAVKGLFPRVLRDAVIDPDTIQVPGNPAAQEILTGFAGGELLPAAETAGMDRLSRMLTARWLTRHEYRLIDGRVWDGERVMQYLDQLTGDGYTLSDAEAKLRDDLQAELTEHEASTEDADMAEDGEDGADQVEADDEDEPVAA